MLQVDSILLSATVVHSLSGGQRRLSSSLETDLCLHARLAASVYTRVPTLRIPSVIFVCASIFLFRYGVSFLFVFGSRTVDRESDKWGLWAIFVVLELQKRFTGF